MVVLLDGKAVAADVKRDVARRVARLRDRGVVPGLAVVLVGDDPASRVYVRNKRRTCERLGIRSLAHDLPETTPQDALLERIDRLNADADVHGILVQLPLPEHIDPDAVVARIDPDKDVDGFHPVNAGNLLLGRPGLTPCTPAGVIRLLDAYEVPIEGRRAIVLGRSRIVGKPMALMLLARHATVTIAHSRTRDLPDLVRQSDIVVAAVGRGEFVRGDWVRPGAAVVDVGIQRNRAGKLVGDVAFHEVAEVAGHLSPVPGGVGPMTIAMLMHNTVVAAAAQSGLDPGVA